MTATLSRLLDNWFNWRRPSRRRAREMEEMDSGLEALIDRLEEHTGARFGSTTFETRLRTQKALYLLKTQGLAPLDTVDFRNYVRGPYSPTLAKLYYGEEEIPRFGPDDWDPPEPFLDVVAEAVNEGDEFLEAVATLHALWKENPGADEERLIDFATHQKPELEEVFPSALEFLDEKELTD